MESQAKEHRHSIETQQENIAAEKIISINNILEDNGNKFSAMDRESGWSNWQWTALLLTALIGLLTIAIWYVRTRRTSRNNFLLMGLSESGKTAIFLRLLYNTFKNSFISINVNRGAYRTGGLVCYIVDLPGEYRIRDKFFEQYKKTAKGIIFVVDSSTITQNCSNVADALFTVLSDVSTQMCPILVLCSKQDLPTAQSVKVIQNLLASEINVLRDTRKRKLQSLELPNAEKTERTVFIGDADKDFEWHHLQQNVQFYDCSAKVEHQLNNLTDWLDRML